MSKTTLALSAPADLTVVDLESLDADQIRTGCEFNPDKMAALAKQMLEHLEDLQAEHAVKATLAGLYLHQARAALGHGNFGPWKAKHFGNATSRMANYYMALAAVFARSSRLLMPELFGANQLTLALTPGGGAPASVLAKLRKFVGKNSLADLLAKHALKLRGGDHRRRDAEGTVLPAEPGKLTIPKDWVWVTAAESARFETLSENARRAWLEWKPRLRAIQADLAAGKHCTHLLLDQQTKDDLVTTFTELLDVLAPHRRK